MESGAKFEYLKKLYALRGLTLTDNGDLSTPGGWLTAKHVSADFEGDQPKQVVYRSVQGKHDIPQVYEVVQGAMARNFPG